MTNTDSQFEQSEKNINDDRESRNAFEAFITEQIGKHMLDRHVLYRDQYRIYTTNVAWAAWKAGRASVKKL